MVNLWPFGKADDSSVAAFEKTLSTLQSKISNATAKRDSLRSNQRRFLALWTLYTSFAYIFFVLITVTVTGRSNWGPFEYSTVAGGPVLIYLVRSILIFYYTYRLSNVQAYITDLQNQREAAIEKFKTATKYNSTQAVLERYGAAPPQTPIDGKFSSSTSDPSRPKSSSGDSTHSTHSKQNQPQPQRTNIAPPPTANIQRPNSININPPSPSHESTSPRLQSPPNRALPPHLQLHPDSARPSPADASFAPNAFDAPPPATPQYASTAAPPGHATAWYDRLLDVLLGEDETKPSNRLALICSSCRLVNGQAPPGVKTLAEVGRWRCGGCRKWNGEDKRPDEVEQILATVKGAAQTPSLTEKEAGKVSDVGLGYGPANDEEVAEGGNE